MINYHYYQFELNSFQTTEEVHLALRSRYNFECRGTVKVKGKGEMTTYFLTGRRSENDLVPSPRFSNANSPIFNVGSGAMPPPGLLEIAEAKAKLKASLEFVDADVEDLPLTSSGLKVVVSKRPKVAVIDEIYEEEDEKSPLLTMSPDEPALVAFCLTGKQQKNQENAERPASTPPDTPKFSDQNIPAMILQNPSFVELSEPSESDPPLIQFTSPMKKRNFRRKFCRRSLQEPK